ncbi:MAG TPA: NAD(P)-dependent oxidoreductase [Actinomycetota bacterium]|nr:NAD(P)-dependent oxidoreductase [Actinomycetota bacterium]
MDQPETVAVVGAGRMGGAMVGTLRRAGIEVLVFNRTRAKAEAVAAATGARVAGTAAEAAGAAGVVISSLADDAAVQDAYGGPEGVAAGLRPGAVVLESSTIDPRTVRALRPLVEERGAALLDAPVSGSVMLVERGELTVMVGGEAAALERTRPVLDVLAANVFHVGELGAGATMKLVVNAILHGLNLALSEGLVLAERAGVARTAAYEVLASSAVAAPFVHYKRAAFERPAETPVAFSLDLVAKDLDLALGLAERTGATMEQAATNRRVVRAAIAAGLGGADLSALATYLRGGGPI